MTTGKEIVKQEASPLAIMGETGKAALAAVQDAMGPGERLTFDLLSRAKIPTGGGKAWTTDEGAPTVLEGVLVLRQPVRAYWAHSFDQTGGGTPPDCSSLDGMKGVGTPGGDCSTCPFAEFGSATDDKGEAKAGQACKQITRMFLLTADSVLPMIINLPPSSYKDAQRYVVTLAGRGIGYPSVITRIGLRQDRSAGGITYSRATFEMVRPLTDEERVTVQQYVTDIRPRLEAMNVASADLG